jgi:hypothetical protein
MAIAHADNQISKELSKVGNSAKKIFFALKNKGIHDEFIKVEKENSLML